MQALKAAPSRLQVNEEPASVEVKLKLADVLVTVPERPDVIVVSGATVSTVQVRLAGEESVTFEGLVARTWKVCEPFAKPE